MLMFLLYLKEKKVKKRFVVEDRLVTSNLARLKSDVGHCLVYCTDIHYLKPDRYLLAELSAPVFRGRCWCSLNCRCGEAFV